MAKFIVIQQLFIVTLTIAAGVNGNPICSDQQFLHRGVCLSLVGGPCSFPTTAAELFNSSLAEENSTANDDYYKFMMECTPGAFCTHATKVGGEFSICTCLPNLTESRDRKCVAGFGESCGDVGCAEAEGLKCSEPLNIGGKCVCKTLHHYQEDLKRCVGLVGAFCNTKKQGMFPDVRCTVGGVCMSRKGQKYGNGECQCLMHHYEETSDRTCRRTNVTISPIVKDDPEDDDGYSSTTTFIAVGALSAVLLTCCLLLCFIQHCRGKNDGGE